MIRFLIPAQIIGALRDAGEGDHRGGKMLLRPGLPGTGAGGPGRLLVRLLFPAFLAFLLQAGCSDSALVIPPGKSGGDKGGVHPPTTVPCADSPAVHAGTATFYTFADGGGSCMFDPTPDDLMVGAMNDVDYAGSDICGSCAEVTGPGGDIIHIRIVDRCTGCGPGGIDLSPLAFSKLADTILGRIPIRWKLAPCPTTGPIVYHFKDGSNPWWTAIQIRNSRYPIAGVEYKTRDGIYKPLERTEYNYFVEPAGMGPGPFTVRVTDIHGQTMTDSGLVLRENSSVPGGMQFPPCRP